MPSALHRSVMVNLRVKGTRKGQAGRFIGKEYKVHTLRPDWVTFTFLPGPPHQQLNFFSPHTKFLEMLGLSAGHKGYTHFNVLWFVILAIIYTMFQDAEKIIKTTSATK